MQYSDDTQGTAENNLTVKEKYKIQKESLTLWWKLALHSYIMQRMWIQIDHVNNEYSDSFERIYQPEKLTQFDRYFARSWSMPSRLTHEASLTIDELAGYRKNTYSESFETPLEAIEEISSHDRSANLKSDILINVLEKVNGSTINGKCDEKDKDACKVTKG